MKRQYDTNPPGNTEADLQGLEMLLKARISAAAKGEVSGKSVEEIADEILRQKRGFDDRPDDFAIGA